MSHLNLPGRQALIELWSVLDNPGFGARVRTPCRHCQRKPQGVVEARLNLDLRFSRGARIRFRRPVARERDVEVGRAGLQQRDHARATASFSGTSTGSPRRSSRPERSRSVERLAACGDRADPRGEARARERSDRAHGRREVALVVSPGVQRTVFGTQIRGRAGRARRSTRATTLPRSDAIRVGPLPDDRDGPLGHDDDAERVRVRAVEAHGRDGRQRLHGAPCLARSTASRLSPVRRERAAHLPRDAGGCAADVDLRTAKTPVSRARAQAASAPATIAKASPRERPEGTSRARSRRSPRSGAETGRRHSPRARGDAPRAGSSPGGHGGDFAVSGRRPAAVATFPRSAAGDEPLEPGHELLDVSQVRRSRRACACSASGTPSSPSGRRRASGRRRRSRTR